MPVNLDKTLQWKDDIRKSVDMYNSWFLEFAPKAFRDARVLATKEVEAALLVTENMTKIKASTLRCHPEVLPTLRMATCPPIAVDRLIGLSGVNPNLVKSMDKDKKIPSQMSATELEKQLTMIGAIIEKLADPDIFVWLGQKVPPAKSDVARAATIVADRLSGANANPTIRNAQEKRQLAAIKKWLEKRGYTLAEGVKFDTMLPGTFSFRMNVPVKLEGGTKTVNIPIDAAIKPMKSKAGELPLFFEAKSAGDFTNTNKRRKEEAVKMSQLRSNYGTKVRFNLFLCGYFDSGYLGYEAAEAIDWVWEHRIDDLAQFGL